MKKHFLAYLLIAIVITLTGCANEDEVLYITPEITEYSPTMSSTPGIALTAVFTRDLKNSDYKFHWIAEEGTFLLWHDEGKGRLADLGNETMTNVHKIYWTVGAGVIEEKSFELHLSVENIYTSEVVAETSIQIKQPEEGLFTIDR